jgi:hypothetical protein
MTLPVWSLESLDDILLEHVRVLHWAFRRFIGARGVLSRRFIAAFHRGVSSRRFVVLLVVSWEVLLDSLFRGAFRRFIGRFV